MANSNDKSELMLILRRSHVEQFGHGPILAEDWGHELVEMVNHGSDKPGHLTKEFSAQFFSLLSGYLVETVGLRDQRVIELLAECADGYTDEYNGLPTSLIPAQLNNSDGTWDGLLDHLTDFESEFPTWQIVETLEGRARKLVHLPTNKAFTAMEYLLHAPSDVN